MSNKNNSLLQNALHEVRALRLEVNDVKHTVTRIEAAGEVKTQPIQPSTTMLSHGQRDQLSVSQVVVSAFLFNKCLKKTLTIHCTSLHVSLIPQINGIAELQLRKIIPYLTFQHVLHAIYKNS